MPVNNGRVLTAREFQGLADVPPEAKWFANIDNRQTRRAYQNDIKDFMSFVGISRPEEFRIAFCSGHFCGHDLRSLGRRRLVQLVREDVPLVEVENRAAEACTRTPSRWLT